MAQRERAKTLKEMAHEQPLLLSRARSRSMRKAARKHLTARSAGSCWAGARAARSAAEWTAAAIHAAVNDLATQLRVGLGKVAQPVRVAVTGAAVSPPIDATLALLGRERSLARLDAALASQAARRLMRLTTLGRLRSSPRLRVGP